MLRYRDDHLDNIQNQWEEYSPDILVLNWGAHYTDDSSLILDIKANIQQLQEYQANCTYANRTCNVFIRTTAPGHSNCQDDNEPVNSIEEMEILVINLVNYNWTLKAKTFMWWEFKHQNEIVLGLYN